jgi:hypothetical protein
MNQVTIVVNQEQAVIEVNINGQTFRKRWVKGHGGATSKGHDFSECEAISDDLCEALEELDLPLYDLIRAIKR